MAIRTHSPSSKLNTPTSGTYNPDKKYWDRIFKLDNDLNMRISIMLNIVGITYTLFHNLKYLEWQFKECDRLGMTIDEHDIMCEHASQMNNSQLSSSFDTAYGQIELAMAPSVMFPVSDAMDHILQGIE